LQKKPGFKKFSIITVHFIDIGHLKIVKASYSLILFYRNSSESEKLFSSNSNTNKGIQQESFSMVNELKTPT